MKVSFSLKDPTTLKSFFKVDSDFLEVLITKETVYFCIYRTGIYSHISFPIISRQNFKDMQAFRIDRKLFLSMIDESLMYVSIVGDGKVLIEIEPNEKSEYNISLDHQQPNISTILNYLDILGREDMFRTIDLNALKSKIQLLRAHDGVVTVHQGMIKMEMDHIDTFVRTSVEDIAIQTNFLKYLLDYSDVTYVYRDAIIGLSEGISIVCNQAIPKLSNEFEFISKAKRLAKFNVDLSPVARLVAKCPPEMEYVNLDLEKKKSYLTIGGTHSHTNNVQLSTNFHAENLEQEIPMSDDDLLNLLNSPQPETEKLDTRFVLPIRLLRDLMAKVTYNLTVEVTKRFLIITNNRDVYFVIGRRNFNER